MNRPTRNTIYGMLVCFAIMPFYACSKSRAEERPFQFVTLDCLFLGQYGTAEQTGKMVASVPKDTLAITISNFDYEKHTAVMIGNAGADEVSFWPSFKKAVLIQFLRELVQRRHQQRSMRFTSKLFVSILFTRFLFWLKVRAGPV